MTVSFAEAIQGGTRRVILQNGEQIDVKIPAGLRDGQQIRVKGRGGAGLSALDLLVQWTANNLPAPPPVPEAASTPTPAASAN